MTQCHFIQGCRWLLLASERLANFIPVSGKPCLETRVLHNISQANGKNGVVDKCTCPQSDTAMNGYASEAVSSDSTLGCCVCPLTRVRAGMTVRVRQLCAGPETQNRLREIGLGEDQIIRLVTSQTNFICQVCNSRLAISEQLARLILVEPVLQPAGATLH